MNRLLPLALVLAVVGSCLPRPDLASAHPVWLPDCAGALHTKPSSVVFACGDGNLYIQKISWTVWGPRYAFGEGTLVENDCTPDCASGHFHSYAASIEAFGAQRCAGGRVAFDDAAYVITDERLPKPAMRTGDSEMRCR